MQLNPQSSIQIQKPIRTVFEAIVDPQHMSQLITHIPFGIFTQFISQRVSHKVNRLDMLINLQQLLNTSDLVLPQVQVLQRWHEWKRTHQGLYLVVSD